MNHNEFLLEGLNCANCAAKIEDAVAKLAGVASASLNLMTTTLQVDTKSDYSGDLTADIKQIVNRHEPDVQVKISGGSAVGEHSADYNRSRAHGDDRVQAQGNHDGGASWKQELIRLVVSLALMGAFLLAPVTGTAQTLGFLAAYILAGYPVLITACKNILRGQIFDENFLMGIASLGAFVIGEYAEAVAVLIFYGVGEMLQDMAVDRSKRNIAGLMNIRPDFANVITEQGIQTVSPESVAAGATLLIRPGERIPLDGTVLSGSSFIDTSALTGESVPREVGNGDDLLSGAINGGGQLEMRVTRVFAESTVSKILDLVQNAGSKKAESEKFITKFARYYTPIVVLIAVGVALFPPLLGFGAFDLWLYRALSFLIISCPCALVISIPLGFFGGIGGAARQGVLIKGGNFLEALTDTETIVFDKTGTLTQGVFQVSGIEPAPGVSREELLELAAIAEQHSTHPIARSVLAHFGQPVTTKATITERAGKGIEADTPKGVILAGNAKLMEDAGIHIASTTQMGTVVHLALDNRYMGQILCADQIKKGAKESIARIKELGVRRIVMLTGDNEETARQVAQALDIDDYRAGLLPQDKVTEFEALLEQKSEKGKLVFVGDGINDAPVLARADIGMAMGGVGSDAAIEAADVVLMHDDLSNIETSLKVARKTRQIVTQNVVFSLGVKLVIMLLAFMGITSMWFAIFADVGVALLALLNATRAMKPIPIAQN